MHRTSLDFWRNFDKRDMASHLISHTLYKVEQMKTSRAHFVVHIGQKPILNYHIFFNTSKCATNYVVSFEVYDGFIGQNILKL